MSYLGNLDEAFTWIAGKVIVSGVTSAVSNNPAEIIHHLERRLANPEAILLAENLVPLTAYEHILVHSPTPQIRLVRKNGFLYVYDQHGAKFRANLKEFYLTWNRYLEEWKHRREETPQS
jgi:hypothetical protein